MLEVIFRDSTLPRGQCLRQIELVVDAVHILLHDFALVYDAVLDQLKIADDRSYCPSAHIRPYWKSSPQRLEGVIELQLQ